MSLTSPRTAAPCLVLLLALSSCGGESGLPGDGGAPLDGGQPTPDAGSTDAGPLDAGRAESDAGPLDGGDSEPDAGLFDSGPPDSGPPDSGPPDSGPLDGGPLDGGALDAGPADGGVSCPTACPLEGQSECSGGQVRTCSADAMGCLVWSDLSDCETGICADVNTCRPALPGTCTTSTECGDNAICDADQARCICDSSSLPCGSSCCPQLAGRNVTLAPAGHSPEIGSDAAGNVYVLYKLGGSSVRLATLLAGETVATTEMVATTASLLDDADLSVTSDGILFIAVHSSGSGRSGTLTLYSRRLGQTGFSTTSLRMEPPDAFAFQAGVGISIAQNGDLYASVAARSGDGTQGLAISRFDGTLGVLSSATILGGASLSESELFARNDGYFIGTYDGGRDFYSFDTESLFLASLASTAQTSALASGAMTSDERLYTITDDRFRLSDGTISEIIPSESLRATGDLDMATDGEDNAFFAYYRISRGVYYSFRMPLGGYSEGRSLWSDAFLISLPDTPDSYSIDAERLRDGTLAFVAGDTRDRGPLLYRELRH